MSSKVQTKVWLPPDVKAMLDADTRNNSDVVESALIAEYGGEKKEALERRIDEINRRISIIESERNERDRELSQLSEQLEGLEHQRDNALSHNEQMVHEFHESASEHIDTSPESPAIKNYASKCSLTPEEFSQRVQELRNS